MKIPQELKYWLVIVIVIAVFAEIIIYRYNSILDYVCQDALVSRSQLVRFSRIFLKEYASIVEHTVDTPYRMYFQFYAEKPYETRIIKSNSKGAALIFIPSDIPKYFYQTTDSGIETTIFPSRKLSEQERRTKMLDVVFNCQPNQPLYIVKARNISFESLEFVTASKEWIEIIGDGTVMTRNIVVDKVAYPHLTKLKASTLRKSWSVNEAKQEAKELFDWEFWPAFEASEDFRKYLSYPELEKIAIYIIENRRNNPDYTMFDLDKDFERLYQTAIFKYNVGGDFAEDVYNYLKERYTLQKKLFGIEYHNNWSYTIVSSLVILLVSIVLVIFNHLFKVYRGIGFRPLLKNLKKRADYFFPVCVCWVLYQQRPASANLFQWLAPWIITILCVYIIYRIEMKFQSSNKTT